MRDTGAGEIVAPDDPQAIAAALTSLYKRWKRGELVCVPADIRRFDWREIARQMAHVLERAIVERGRL